MKPDRENVNKRILSHTSLGWFKKSPAYFKFKIENPEVVEETPALVFGNLFHTMVLEPHEIDNRFLIFNQEERPEPDKTMASKLNKEWKSNIVASLDDKKLITLEQHTTAKLMMESVNEQAGDLLKYGKTFERKIEWRKEGVDFKGFIDIDAPDYMVDLKTALDANPREWYRKAFWNFQSHRQAAMYLDGDSEGLYTGDKEFYFVVVEKEPPYLVSVNLVSKAKIAEGMTQYKELTKGVKDCRKSGKWPHFDKPINVWE